MSASHLFLYKIQPVRSDMLTQGTTSDEEQIISQHFAYLQNLTKSGIVKLAGRTLNTDSSSFGIVILMANTEQEAQDIMQNDPAVKLQVMHAEFYPFRIALLGDIAGLLA